MSIRSLITTGLLATAVLASPPGYGATSTATKTKTVTETQTQYKTKYSTVTEHASCSASQSTSASASSSHSSSGSSSGSSGSTSASSASTTSASASASTTSSSASNTNPTTTLLATATATNYGLSDAAKAAGKLWFGTAADIPGVEQNDQYYMAEFNNTHDFISATPANIMKFEFTEPEQGVFNYTGAQEFLDIAKAAGKEYVRCHNLIWESELPTWVTNPTTNWTNETLSAVVYNHAYTLVSHFGDQCYSWDVVNEALSDSPAGAYQNNIWYDTIGPAYVVEAFQAATDAVRDNNLAVKLYYNDYNIEYPGNKSTAAQNIVKELKGRGIQIDGVGLESHFIAGKHSFTDTHMSNPHRTDTYLS